MTDHVLSHAAVNQVRQSHSAMGSHHDQINFELGSFSLNHLRDMGMMGLHEPSLELGSSQLRADAGKVCLALGRPALLQRSGLDTQVVSAGKVQVSVRDDVQDRQPGPDTVRQFGGMLDGWVGELGAVAGHQNVSLHGTLQREPFSAAVGL